MKRSIILAALILSMAVPVFAEEELVWEEQAATEETYAFEEEEDVSVDEQTAIEEPSYVFEEAPETIEEQTTEEEVAGAEIAFDENVDQEENVEESVYEEQIVTEETAASPVAVEDLIYTGLPQALITPQPGSWLYSLDGETYTSELPTAINAGTYTVYMKEGEAEAVVITVTIAKADVIFTPPVANTTTQPATTENEQENGEPAYAAGEENEVGEGAAEPAYSGDEPAYADEVVFE